MAIEKLTRKNKSDSLINVASEDDIQNEEWEVKRPENKLPPKTPRQLLIRRPVIIALIIIAIAVMMVEGIIIYNIIF
jgi:hypothetical protein